jgi:hypothetical protein
VRSRSKNAAAVGAFGFGGLTFADGGFDDLPLEVVAAEAEVLDLDAFDPDVLDLDVLDLVALTAGSLDRSEKRETPRWGIGASQPGKPVGGGPIVGIPPSGRWGVFSLRSCL